MCLPLGFFIARLYSAMFFVGLFVHFFPLVLSFITFFLLGFLLIGCASTSSAYSSVYLIKVAYNASSTASTKNGTSGALRVNYMALCSTTSGTMECSTSRNYTALSASSMVSLPGGRLSLADMASQLNDVCTPYILVAVLAMVLVLVICELWLAVPLVPWKTVVRRAVCGVSLVTALLWGLGAMLQHQALRCAQAFIGAATLSAVAVSLGTRAEALSWTSFTFLVLVFFSSALRAFRDAPVTSEKG